MGAGNYFFSAPAGDEWSRMIYVDLQPEFWSDELKRRDTEFDEYLKLQPAIQSRLAQLESEEPGASQWLLEETRNTWNEDNAYWTNEAEFAEEQTDFQLESVYASLSDQFALSISRPKRNHCEVIADGYVLATIGRMSIVQAFTYYGDRLAVMVTPRRDLQDDIYAIENDHMQMERGWHHGSLQAMRRQNLAILNLKRSLKTGALMREMLQIYDLIVLALHKYGLSENMSYRSGAWTSSAYKSSETYANNEKLLKVQAKRSKATASVGV